MPDRIHTISTPPTWRAKDVVGKLAVHEHLWDRSPFRFGGGQRSHEEQIQAKHTSSLPSFGALRRDNTPTAACLIILCSCSRELIVFLASESVEPPLRCAWASFYMLKGSPTGGNADEGKNGKEVAVGTTTCTVHPTIKAHDNLCFPLGRAYLLLYARVKVIFTFPFFILSFGKHLVLERS